MCVCVCVKWVLQQHFPFHPDSSIKIMKILYRRAKFVMKNQELGKQNHVHIDRYWLTHTLRWGEEWDEWNKWATFFIRCYPEFSILWGQQLWIEETFHSILIIHPFMWSIIVTFRCFIWQCVLNLTNNLFPLFAFHYNFLIISFSIFSLPHVLMYIYLH